MAETRCPKCDSWDTDELDNSGWCVCLSCEHEWQEVDDLEDPENFGLVTSYDIEMGKMDEIPDDASPPTAGEAE